MRISIRFLAAAAAALVLIGGTAAGAPAKQENREPDPEPSASLSIGYLELFEGLHVTGTPSDIDEETYRLKISGAVDRELSLSFEEVKGRKAVIDEIALNCPGFFTDTGVWTGVPIRDLLLEAGLSPTASTVKFISYEEDYTQQLPVDRVMEGDVLVAYEFDGKEFHRVHGFPLRIAAPGVTGSVWVKWLGEIRVE